jgi:electron-transferring-flavoprotein dehydrogenase
MRKLSVCLEKGSEVGAHILSGAVFDPKAIDELMPDWKEQGCPMAEVPVTENHHWVLTRHKHLAIPHILTPGWMHNKGTYTGSLGNLCRWLATQAENLGVEIFPGFPAAEILYNEDGSVKGVATGDMGVARDGSHKPDYMPGMELHAKYTCLQKGARGHLTKQLKSKYDLEANCQPQVYGIGMKELWDIDPDKHHAGRVIHTQGWPLTESDSWGGGFLYHQANNQVAPRASSSRSIMPIRTSFRSRNSSAGSSTRKSARFGRRQAHVLWRARDQRRRLAVRAQARLPRRRADRLFGRLSSTCRASRAATPR